MSLLSAWSISLDSTFKAIYITNNKAAKTKIQREAVIVRI